MKKYYVSTHVDKETKKVLYVGKGSGFRSHSSFKRKYNINNVNIPIIASNFKNEKLAYLVEEQLTSYYKSIGEAEYNIKCGNKLTKEHVEKLHKSVKPGGGMKGKHHTEEAKEKIKKNHARPMLGKYRDGIAKKCSILIDGNIIEKRSITEMTDFVSKEYGINNIHNWFFRKSIPKKYKDRISFIEDNLSN